MTKFKRRLLYLYYKFSLLFYILKKDEDFDYSYFLKLIYKKLTNLALVIRKENLIYSDKKIAHQIWEARKILKKVLYYDYNTNEDTFIHSRLIEKYGYTVDFRVDIVNHFAEFVYYPVYHINRCCVVLAEKPNDFAQVKEEYEFLLSKSRQLAFIKMKSDLKKFFEYVVEHVWEWAD